MPGNTKRSKAIVTYGIAGDFNQLDPAPFVTLEYIPRSANDSVIGYDWKCNISGYAVSEIESSTGANSSSTMDKISKIIHGVFDKTNGGTLFVLVNGGEVIKATGSKVVSISVESNNNNWVNYAKYSVDIMFNDVVYKAACDGRGRTIDCENVLLLNYPGNLVNSQLYNIKSFKDGWTFSIDENNQNSIGLFIHNQYINVSYSIEAEGAHYYVDQNTKTIPAWEQAKIFCQDRLYKQVNSLLTEILPGSNQENTCAKPFGINGAYLVPGQESRSMVDFKPEIYEVYNEDVSTTASESNGTFSVKYTAIVKRKVGAEGKSTNMPLDKDVLHTITVNRGFANHYGTKKTNVSLSGKIQGLTKRGLWKSPNIFDMNKQNQEMAELLSNDDDKAKMNNKYKNAREYWDALNFDNGRDLIKDFKDYLNITYSTFYVTCDELSGPRPTTLNHSHNYSEGTIDYSASFDTEKVCAGREANFTDVSFVFEDTIENFAEFVIPGRPNGPLVQRLNSFQPRSVTLNITGFRDTKDCCWDFNKYGEDGCNRLLVVDGYIPYKEIDNAILTEDNLTMNPVDGSFNLSRKYVYYDREI